MFAHSVPEGGTGSTVLPLLPVHRPNWLELSAHSSRARLDGNTLHARHDWHTAP